MKTDTPSRQSIVSVHQLYCHLTSQNLSLRFDRQRLWYELLASGFTPADITTVIRYLQREIKEGRRNIGALKLSNLLQPDKFEEDLHISRASLTPPKKTKPNPNPQPPPQPMDDEQRLIAARKLAALRQKINASPGPVTSIRRKRHDTSGTKPL